jgi:hypothetical protein
MMKSSRLLFIAYGIGTTGVLLQIEAAHWDVSWHILGIVETFFTPPHAVLYTGIFLTIIAALLGLYLRMSSNTPLLTGLQLAAVGGGMQLVAGPLDFWWHATYGFDPYLFTPTHSILITGLIVEGVGMALGAARLLDAHNSGRSIEGFVASGRVLQAMVVITLAVLWLDMNFFLNWLFNAQESLTPSESALRQPWLQETAPSLWTSTRLPSCPRSLSTLSLAASFSWSPSGFSLGRAPRYW